MHPAASAQHHVVKYFEWFIKFLVQSNVKILLGKNLIIEL